MACDPQTKVPKLPFILGDVLLVTAAAWIVYRGTAPLRLSQDILVVVAVGLGAWLCAIPFLRDHSASVRLIENEEISSAVERIGEIKELADRISLATAQWQTMQDQSGKTVDATREIAEKMQNEAKAFTEFLKRANESERTHIKLELEKMRRAESEWVGVMVGVLDQVFALNRAAIQSGQVNVIEQVGNFQAVCVDIARRIGFISLAPAPGESFDPARHSTMESAGPADPSSTIIETLAPGYSFQGQLLRRAVVAVEQPVPPEPDSSSEIADLTETATESRQKPASATGAVAPPDETFLL